MTPEIEREIKKFERIVKMSLDGLIRQRWDELKQKLLASQKEMEEKYNKLHTKWFKNSLSLHAKKQGFNDQKRRIEELERKVRNCNGAVNQINQEYKKKEEKIASLEAEKEQLQKDYDELYDKRQSKSQNIVKQMEDAYKKGVEDEHSKSLSEAEGIIKDAENWLLNEFEKKHLLKRFDEAFKRKGVEVRR